MKKNDVYTVTLSDTCSNGCGFCRIDNTAVFVKNGVCGDRCEIKIIKVCKSYCVATVTKMLERSGKRIEPKCKLNRCGGCVFQCLSEEYENELKADFVRAALMKEGLENIKVANTRSTGKFSHYRNKAQFPVADSEQGIKLGFYASKSHEVIECSDCMINPPVFSQIAQHTKLFCEIHGIKAYNEETNKGVLRHIFLRCTKNAEKIMLCLVTNGEKFEFKNEFVESVRTNFPNVCSIYQNINDKTTNAVLGEKFVLWYGEEKLCDTLCNHKFFISPESFYQVNRECCELLYNTGRELLMPTKSDVVLDLYCGIGSVGICAASGCGELVGIEIVPKAAENARENAKLNKLENAEFYAADACDTLSFTKKLGKKFSAVIVDPPRKGLGKQVVELVATLNPERVLYISCDYSTLCRDLKYFAPLGYTTNEIIPVNMFPRTSHVETVVLLSHKKPDGHINVKVEFGEGEGKVPLDDIAERAENYKPKERVTYKMIKEYIEAKYGFKVHTAYIAEVKRDLGLPMYDAPNAVEELKNPRKHPTPEKVEAIKDALKHFEVI